MENLKQKKILKKKNKKIIPHQILLLKKCTTKNKLIKTLLNLPPNWKNLIKLYITDCFIFDLYTRKLQNKFKLLENREIFYEIIDNPELLNISCHFDNNMIKNFCTGVSNYLNIHYIKMNQILEEKKRILKK